MKKEIKRFMALIQRSSEAIQIAQLENQELREKLDKQVTTKAVEVPQPPPPPPFLVETSYLYSTPHTKPHHITPPMHSSRTFYDVKVMLMLMKLKS